MAPDQVTRLRARAYALIGAGIAGLIAAYQFKTTAASTTSLIFGIAGVLLLAFGVGLLLRTMSRQTAQSQDLDRPQAAKARIFGFVGLAGLAGIIAIDHFAPAGTAWRFVTYVLIAVVGVSFIIAGRIARQIKAGQGAK